jgi:hypothetical protein
MFVTMNPGHPLKMLNDGPSVEEAFWQANRIVEGADPGTDVFDFCTRLYQHQHTADPSFQQVYGGEMRFHKRCLAIARSCMVLAGHDASASRSTWSHHCWMTDAVKCSTERDAGEEIAPCIDNCGTFLRRELELLDPSVIVAFGPSPERTRQALLATALSEAGAPPDRVIHWSGKGRSVYQNFAKLEDPVHDDRFAAVARLLGKNVPPEFRTVRASIYREYFPFSSLT